MQDDNILKITSLGEDSIHCLFTFKRMKLSNIYSQIFEYVTNGKPYFKSSQYAQKYKSICGKENTREHLTKNHG